MLVLDLLAMFHVMNQAMINVLGRGFLLDFKLYSDLFRPLF